MSSPTVKPLDDGRVHLQVDAQLDREQLDALIQQLGAARAAIAKDPPDPKGLLVQLACDPAYWVEMSATTDWKSTVLFRHPYFGWTGLSLSLVETARLAKLLGDNLLVMIEREQAGAALTQAANNPAGGSGGERPH